MAKVFYSWQSDLPNKTNRGLIADALDKAAKTIRDDDTLQVEPVVDRDTEGVAGAPDISATIFAKIERASAFVCDVSIVNQPAAGQRPMPNPNVLVELGYAARALGWERIVMVINTAYGAVEQLPFDLRRKRAVVYRSAPDETERAPARAQLARTLEDALRAILAEPLGTEPSAFEKAVEGIETSRPDRVARATDYMQWLTAQLAAICPACGGARPDDEELVDALTNSVPLVVQFAQLAEMIARHGALESAVALMRGFESILQGYFLPPGRGGSFRQTDFDFAKFVGHELFVTLASALLRAERFDVLQAVLDVDLCVDTNNGRVNQPWMELSEYCALLDDVRNQRLKLGRASVRADLLKARHTTGDLARVSPFEAFMEADYFLFLAADLHPQDSPLISFAGGAWRPWSNLFMEWKAPAFLVRSERTSFAQKLLGPLKLPDIDTFRARYAERGRLVARLFERSVGIFHLGQVKPETIGSRA